MNDGQHPDLAVGLVVGVVLLLVAVPLAGCVGGSDGAGSSSDDGPLPDGQTDGEGPAGNGTGPGAGDAGAHTHDRWRSGPDQLQGDPVEKITLVDGTYTIDAFNESNPEKPDNGCRMSGGDALCYGKKIVQPMDSGEGTKVVPPGTGNITVKVSYDQGSYEGIAAFYTNRFYKSQSGRTPWQNVAEEPMQDGDEARISALSWRTADDGHAHTSQWEFLFEVRGNPVPGPLAYSFTDHDGLDVDIKIVAHQDPNVPPLPLEPPHPKFYGEDPDGNTSVYRVATVGGDASDFTHAGPGYGSVGGCYWQTGVVCLPYTIGEGLTWVTAPGYKGATQDDYTENKQKLPDDGLTSPLVPPGTAKILVEVEFSNSEGDGVELCLLADNGDGAPYTECQDPTQGDSLTYSVPIDGGFDSYYANNWGTNASRWTFYLHLQSASEVASYDAFSVREPASFSGTFSATIVASEEAGLEEVPSIVAT